MSRTSLFWVTSIIMTMSSYSQCAMCRVVAESSQDAGGTIANSLNKGILYLMSFPYLLIFFGLILFFYRYQKIN